MELPPEMLEKPVLKPFGELQHENSTNWIPLSRWRNSRFHRVIGWNLYPGTGKASTVSELTINFVSVFSGLNLALMK
jgi:hypothetical protein